MTARGVLVAVALLAVACGALGAALWWGQERLIFFPQRLPAEHRFDVGDDVHEAWVDVPGARLHALHLQVPDPRAIVFYLHGNGGSLDGWFSTAGFYRSLGVDLFMIDYRGYGKSGGRIDGEAQLHDDVAAAWRSIAPRYAGRPVVFVGRSLGTGLAVALAASLPAAERPDLLVLVSPYRSLRSLAAEHYPWVPTALLRYPLDTEALLPGLVASPRPRVLLLHGDRDRLIPISHARALAAAWPAATLRAVVGGGHDDLQQFPDYLGAIRDAIGDTIGAVARPR